LFSRKEVEVKKHLSILSSLELAVFVLVALSVSLAVGTFLESYFDIRTARYWVYESFWFTSLLFLLAVNLFAVMVSRWPWKRRHSAFLMAHIGILTVLLGGWITGQFGVDGTLQVSEGETNAVVRLGDEFLMIRDRGDVKAIPIKWRPPGRKFSPIEIDDYALVVDDFISRADADLRFKAPQREIADQETQIGAAVHLRLEGGPLNISHDFWLWGGDPGWSVMDYGPARIYLLPRDGDFPSQPIGESLANLVFKVNPKGELNGGTVEYLALGSQGVTAQGDFPFDIKNPKRIDPGWMDMIIYVLGFVPQAVNESTYVPARIQYGERAPSSAIRLRTKDAQGEDATLWLGLGDQASLQLEDRTVKVSYVPRQVLLPFGLELQEFEMTHNPGTRDPATYASDVIVKDRKNPFEIRISMNEPLQHAGYTIYQASYIPADPRPVTSIFSVNRDPGRPLTYAGSLILVLGVIWLFMGRYMKNKKRGV
jgi:hypothetical protein